MSSATFPQRLRESRLRAGLSGKALAAKSLVSQPSIVNLQRGRTMPGIDTVERLATALDVDPRWLAYGAK